MIVAAVPSDGRLMGYFWGLYELRVKKVKASHTQSLPSVGPGADPGVQEVSPQSSTWR